MSSGALTPALALARTLREVTQAAGRLGR